jgi:hypothetical protein
VLNLEERVKEERAKFVENLSEPGSYGYETIRPTKLAFLSTVRRPRSTETKSRLWMLRRSFLWRRIYSVLSTQATGFLEQLRRKKVRSDDSTFVGFVFLLWAVFVIAIWIATIWAAVHFIRKYW